MGRAALCDSIVTWVSRVFGVFAGGGAADFEGNKSLDW